jgi:uncharacterized protein (DUF1330 family)
MVLVAILTVRKDAIEEFRAYETQAARIMKEHGGRIERVIVAADTAETIKEIHVVTFPDDAAFKAYRQSPQLAGLAPLRDASIVGTDIHIGADGPAY